MANNGGRQGGGGGGNQNMNEHVEFTVKAGEDLYLTGSENTILRVAAETNYSCLMLKTQRFSSLFRHYAKYHGLRKDDLEYYFVNALENEDTPESVQLQRGDTIMVRKRRRPEPPEAAADEDEFFKDMRELLDDEEHMDAVFLVVRDGAPTINNSSDYLDHTPIMPTSTSITGTGTSSSTATKSLSGNKRDSSGNGKPTEVNANANAKANEATPNTTPVKSEQDEHETSNNTTFTTTTNTASSTNTNTSKSSSTNMIEIRAHKCILTARAEYFKAHLRKSACSKDPKTVFKDSNKGIINVDPCFTEQTIRLMLEFIYTNRIQDISSVSTNDLMLVLHLSDRWVLRDLKRLVEHQLIKSHMDVNTVARMYCATEDYNAERLARACINYIMDNIREVTGNKAFQDEMKHYPHLCIPVLRAAADLIPEQPLHKKQRTSGDHSGSGGASSTPAAAAVSSPVPDIDP